MKPMFEHFRAAGGDPHLIEPVLGVDPDYLRSALDEMHQKFGSIEGHFSNGLGIDARGQQGLREALRQSSIAGRTTTNGCRRRPSPTTSLEPQREAELRLIGMVGTWPGGEGRTGSVDLDRRQQHRRRRARRAPIDDSNAILNLPPTVNAEAAHFTTS